MHSVSICSPFASAPCFCFLILSSSVMAFVLFSSFLLCSLFSSSLSSSSFSLLFSSLFLFSFSISSFLLLSSSCLSSSSLFLAASATPRGQVSFCHLIKNNFQNEYCCKKTFARFSLLLICRESATKLQFSVCVSVQKHQVWNLDNRILGLPTRS